MNFIRPATEKDASRIAEIIVTNYRVNFYPFFRNDSFYFGELNVLETASEYKNGSETLQNTFVYDDGVVKGIIRINGSEIEKLYVEPQFQNQGIGAELLQFAVEKKKSGFLWVLEYNKRGISFYRKHGFELTGEKIIEDEFVPLLKMSRDISKNGIYLKKVMQDSPDKDVLDGINNDSFPPYERSSLDNLYASADNENLDILGIYADDKPVGFLAVRKYKKIRYLAYFAVCREERSKGIGSKALGLLKKLYSGSQIVTEFESPDNSAENNDIRLKRRDFYLRNSFSETDWRSFYDDTEFVIACSDTKFNMADFKGLVLYLRTKIPGYKPDIYRKL